MSLVYFIAIIIYLESDVLSLIIGTGKTSTLIETILQIFANVKDSKILVATPSNSGANLICEHLLRAHAFEKSELVRLHSHNAAIKGKTTIAGNVREYSAKVDTSFEDFRRNELEDDDELDEEELDVTNVIHATEVASYRVVVTTCTLMGCMQMRQDAPVYSHVFIDEAGQCTEPEALIPIQYLDKKNGQIVLAGDPKQLGPVVFSIPAKNRNLGKSLLGRILELPLYQENLDVCNS